MKRLVDAHVHCFLPRNHPAPFMPRRSGAKPRYNLSLSP